MASHAYQYDGVGLLDSITTTDVGFNSAGSNVPVSTTIDYGFGVDRQLARVENDAFQHDKAGNPNGLAVGDQNRVATTSFAHYRYDGEGNRIVNETVEAGSTLSAVLTLSGGIVGTESVITSNYNFTELNGPGHRGDVLHSTDPRAEVTAAFGTTYPADHYRVSVTWPADTGMPHHAETMYEVYVNGALAAFFTVDQNEAPSSDGIYADGVYWKSFPVLNVAHNAVIKVKALKNGDTNDTTRLVFDAIRIESVGNEQRYDYDFRNRLTRVTEFDVNDQPLSAVDYLYNVLGDRIGRETRDWNGTTPADLNADGVLDADDMTVRDVEYYVNDGAERILELDAAGDVARRYLYGAAVDELLAVEHDYIDDMQTPADDTDDVTRHVVGWTLADHQQTIQHVYGKDQRDLDQNGQPDNVYKPLAEYAFNAFGGTSAAPIYDAGILDLDPRYLGADYDAATGLYDFGTRSYDPELRQYISPGGVGGPSSDPNPYRFAGNAPISPRRDRPTTASELYTDWKPAEVDYSKQSISYAIASSSPLEVVHVGLDAAGLFPALGFVPDLINAGIYALEGRGLEAGISLAAAIPVAGHFATGGKYTAKAIHVGMNVAEASYKAGGRVATNTVKYAGGFVEGYFDARRSSVYVGSILGGAGESVERVVAGNRNGLSKLVAPQTARSTAGLGAPKVASNDILATPNRLQNKLAAWRRYEGDLKLPQWSKQYDQLQINAARGRWRESISRRMGLGEPGHHIYTPVGDRIPDAIDGIILREIKDGPVTFSPFVRKQIGKDFYLQRRGYQPEWHLHSGASKRVLDQLETFGIPYFLH